MIDAVRPDFLYRLVTVDEWRAAQESGTVPLREIDERDGYVHLSTKTQVIETANLHFADADNLLALEIRFDAIAANIRFELAPKRGEAFPHLYGVLYKNYVRRALRLARSEHGFAFEGAL